ncbi:Hsp70 family protein [Desulfosarcina ovata]|uniref:Heat-shock protein n=1 Tax=Desulfosarcina ovata subsp. ovata TaxID=2752305 RepID=A0A5K8AAQ5_9BACT|nr:Hsp70 family protein [Desulfosarcina ovata]BBO89030.1 heat-shock protein [Desulfosarcina ovata subsp. ovata]
MNDPVYIIGLDLGTTNSIVAYTEADADDIEKAPIRVLEIPQLVDSGVVESRPALPSFVLVTDGMDTAPDALALPWNPSPPQATGEYARRRGEEIPQRLIASSKSWLCNTFVDRNAPILPWDNTADKSGIPAESKLSPVAASAAILRHIRDAWNHLMAGSATDPDERLRFENQKIYLTVPASFDAVARELTVAAADLAGLANITLLEEPQAAFYAWLAATEGGWRDAVTAGDLILVCDVGGGTSDFSLIQVGDEDGDLVLERVAVGNHLLVGGDNMDLALAYALARQLAESGTRLDSWQMNGLWHSCRRAKEQILSDAAIQSQPVTILGRGSSLIGGTIKTELTRETIESILRDGFFPACGREDRPAAAQRAGIREFGLAFEADPGITRHLAAFLARHPIDGQLAVPTAVLFNGGVMKAGLLREHILSVLGGWSAEGSINALPTRDFDLAVARGAACYGLAREGKGIRIRGGLGRSYYIGIAASMPAVPGMPAPTKALCVAPFGTEEGTTTAISDREFVLLVGESATFDFLGSTTRTDDPIGTVVEDWTGEIDPITTLETTLEGENGQAIPVTLELTVTEVGTLELWCVSTVDERRWRLEFNVREH